MKKIEIVCMQYSTTTTNTYESINFRFIFFRFLHSKYIASNGFLSQVLFAFFFFSVKMESIEYELKG